MRISIFNILVSEYPILFYAEINPQRFIQISIGYWVCQLGNIFRFGFNLMFSFIYYYCPTVCFNFCGKISFDFWQCFRRQNWLYASKIWSSGHASGLTLYVGLSWVSLRTEVFCIRSSYVHLFSDEFYAWDNLMGYIWMSALQS